MNNNIVLKNGLGTFIVSLFLCLFFSCSNSDTPVDETTVPKGNCLENGTKSTISGNHGHVLTVSKAEVVAGTSKTYDIQGTAGHAHSVTLTSEDFTTLKINLSIVIASTTDAGHTHAITIACAE
ncbi:hypothetical protein MWU65_07810 [Cellulophaga sp. F20128]|uniref:hypothetical protein n=1 Tax=Cellulophaga sp. F20128 TaxID=2926413 RepID=UPI001FF1A044|nr:hypothetical protein [Cellulophaga sp. F20128]MCK0157078.1 hypothetical protein [Cellulophaga sp. F20128]